VECNGDILFGRRPAPDVNRLFTLKNHMTAEASGQLDFSASVPHEAGAEQREKRDPKHSFDAHTVEIVGGRPRF
jgi:hypothetical protein